MENNAILIAGPTASGKSGVALDLAARINGAIINTDSMQIYRDLSILTARPTPDEMGGIPHLLYGVLDASEVCSAGKWLDMAKQAYQTVQEQGRVPIFVGGTGLYFRALTEGLAPIPDIPPDVLLKGEALHQELGAQAFFDRLCERDANASSQLRVSDTQRVLRAWAVVEATGQPLSDWQKKTSPAFLPDPAHRIVIEPDRDWLYARINQRFDDMVAMGVLEEVRALAARSLPGRLPAMRALGVPHLAAHLKGEISLEEAVEKAKTGSRRYAKRQMTWFRNQMITWNRLVAQDSESIKSKIFNIILD